LSYDGFYIVLPTAAFEILCNLARCLLQAPWEWHGSV